MFRIGSLDFYGSPAFDGILDALFPDANKERMTDESGYTITRIYIPNDADDDAGDPIADEDAEPERTEPPSILDDSEFENWFGGDCAKPKSAEDNPFVFIANRLTFLIQTKFPLVFDTSIINNHEKSLTIAVNEDKTVPKLNCIEDLGFITSEVNNDEEIQREIDECLGGTRYGNIYCFPTIMSDRKGGSTAAVKFVVYPRK